VCWREHPKKKYDEADKVGIKKKRKKKERKERKEDIIFQKVSVIIQQASFDARISRSYWIHLRSATEQQALTSMEEAPSLAGRQRVLPCPIGSERELGPVVRTSSLASSGERWDLRLAAWIQLRTA